MIYLIGSLRNPDIGRISTELRRAGLDVFDDWYAAGPNADDHWRDYEKRRGRTYAQALEGKAAVHIFDFDLAHLHLADTVVLALPAGRSAHMEFGWCLGRGKKGYVLLDTPERWDVMYLFATRVCTSLNELLTVLTC